MSGSRLTGLRHGQAVVAIGEAPSQQLVVQVIENYNGVYPSRGLAGDVDLGEAHAVECNEYVRGWCAGNIREERLGKGPEPFAMRLAQTESSVTGVAYIRCGNATVSGEVNADGSLRLRGAFGLKPPPTCHIQEWSTFLEAGGWSLSGRFRVETTFGNATFELRSVPRTR